MVGAYSCSLGFHMHSIARHFTLIAKEVWTPATIGTTGFQFRGPSGLIFEVTQDVTWSAGDASTKTVPVREGAAKRVTAASTGEGNQEIRLAAALGEDKYLIQGTVQVFVDGAEWTEVEFLEFETTDIFEVHYLDEPPVIRFGNGVAGNIPQTGAEIRVLFVVGSGNKGNVAANSITGVIRPLVQRFETIALVVNNPDPTSGGAGPEDMDSAKINAPRYFASRGVAVTEDDYKALSAAFVDPQYGKPSKATAYCARTTTGDAEANNLINDARAEVESYQTSLDASATTLGTTLDDMQTSVDDAQVQVATTDGKLADIESKVVVINSGALTIQGRSAVLQDTIDLLEDALNDNTTGFTITIDDVIDILVAEGYAAEAAELTEIRNQLTASKNALTTAKSEIDGAATAIKSANQDIQTAVDDAQVAQATLTVDLADIEADIANAQTTRDSIAVQVAGHQVAINNDFDDLIEHLDEVIAADCKSNVISVPILAEDGDGFYVAPTTGLIRRLQEYLQDRADVAHSVSVVSGEFQLIAASIVLQIKRLDAYTFQEVATDCEAAVKAMLKSRNFGDSLYLHQIHKTLQAIPGVDVANVEITGDVDFLDDSGNLIADQEHVITYSSIDVEELV